MSRALIAAAVVALAVTASAAAIPTQSMSPDDRAFSRMSVQSNLALNDRAHSTSPDDRAFSRAVVSIQPNLNPNPVQVVVHDNGGYRWLHAGEGVVVGFGFALLLGGLVLLIVRSRRVVPAV
jgi:hypothetical protein